MAKKKAKTLEELIVELPPDLKEQVRDYVEVLLQHRVMKPRRRHLKVNWAGGLKEYRDQYTALELQKKSLEWWVEEYLPPDKT